mgnify:CR=1 FL=1
MTFLFNGRPMGYPYSYPFPLFFYMSSNRKITPEQLRANLRKVVQRYVNGVVNENKRLPEGKKDTGAVLRDSVKAAVNKAIADLLEDMKIEGVAISSSSGAASAADSKVFNLGSYVKDLNAELNQMINDGIPN